MNNGILKFWEDEAKEILRNDKLDFWNEIVPIRLNDLYRGMELDCTISIGKILNKGVESFEEAKQELEGQSHSGMSHGLVVAMVKEFCNNGEEFVEWYNK